MTNRSDIFRIRLFMNYDALTKISCVHKIQRVKMVEINKPQNIKLCIKAIIDRLKYSWSVPTFL
jgi:hypothetical protein